MNDRTCIVTRESKPPHQMVRFVVGPDLKVVPDIKAHLPGRGAWVVADRQLLGKAIRQKSFARAFKANVVVPPDLAELTGALLTKATLGSLALARKSGAIVTGALKVDAAIRSGQAVMVLHAQEAAEDGKRKILQAIHAAEKRGWDKIPVSTMLTGEELSLAFGDNHVIHAALLKGVASKGFIERVQKLQFYRGEPTHETTKAVKGTE